MNVNELVESASLALNQWRIAQDKIHVLTIGFPTQKDGAEHWTVPDINKVKVNIDAALFKDIHCFSVASIARDHSGDLIEAFSKCRLGSVKPAVAEVIRIREALSWIKRKGWSNVEVETDSLLAVQAVRSSTATLIFL